MHDPEGHLHVVNPQYIIFCFYSVCSKVKKPLQISIFFITPLLLRMTAGMKWFLPKTPANVPKCTNALCIFCTDCPSPSLRPHHRSASGDSFHLKPRISTCRSYSPPHSVSADFFLAIQYTLVCKTRGKRKLSNESALEINSSYYFDQLKCPCDCSCDQCVMDSSVLTTKWINLQEHR